MDQAENSRPSLAEMAASLRHLDDNSWGMYLFSRDLLRDRITPGQKREMTEKSIHCGMEYADRIRGKTGACAVEEMPDRLGLHTDFNDEEAAGKRVLFASYTPPDQITVMTRPLEKYAALLASLPPEEAALLPPREEVLRLLLGHEIYHFTEEKYQDAIYTRTEKIRLWKFLWFENDSTVRALGEIAGMAFARALAGVSYFPALLDVLLLFGYNENYSRSIYQNIMSIDAAQRDSRG